MDLARRVYTRELKVAAMREIDSGRTLVEVARQLEVSPKAIEGWRTEWRARGELAFPGHGRPGAGRGLSELARIAELERKIGQLTMENDFLKKVLAQLKARQPLAVVSGAALSMRKSGKPPRKANRKP